MKFFLTLAIVLASSMPISKLNAQETSKCCLILTKEGPFDRKETISLNEKIIIKLINGESFKGNLSFIKESRITLVTKKNTKKTFDIENIKFIKIYSEKKTIRSVLISVGIPSIFFISGKKGGIIDNPVFEIAFFSLPAVPLFGFRYRKKFLLKENYFNDNVWKLKISYLNAI